jgi:thiol-disulfide isomerase/thioredoxin
MLFIAYLSILGQAPLLDLHLVPSGAFARVGGFRPYGLTLEKTAPTGAILPPSLTPGAEFGTLRFGSSTAERNYFLAVEEPVTAESRIFVDEDGAGDLTKYPPLKWTPHQFKSSFGAAKTEYSASITVDLHYRDAVVPCTVNLYTAGNGQFGYYGDFSLQGKATLKGVSYDAIYWDSTAAWNPATADGTLMIDTKHDGNFHPAYDFFNPNQPFNIKGTTYELAKHGETLAMVPSRKWVKERTLADTPADPNLSNGLHPGELAPTFSDKRLDGSHVSFPKSYAGKLVMIDFWATWCGPCMREAPNVAAVYAKYHSQGLDILGVSLDNPNSKETIEKTTSHVGMTWPQIYDGDAWKGKLVKEFGIKAIPATYLVDGDTGKIVAMLSQLRGPQLEQTVKKALAAKQK